MVTVRKASDAPEAPRPSPVAGDVVYSLLNEMRQSWNVEIDGEALTITSKRDGARFGYKILDGRLDRAVYRAYGGERPDFR